MLQTECILDRITERCIVAAKSNVAKQRLVEAAIVIATETEKHKQKPSILPTIGLGIVLGFICIWAAYEVIVIGLAT